MTRGRFENVVDEAGPEFARYPAEGRNPLRGDRELLDYLLRLPPRGFEGRHHEVATGVAFLRSGSAHDLRLVNKPSAVSHPGHTESCRDAASHQDQLTFPRTPGDRQDVREGEDRRDHEPPTRDSSPCRRRKPALMADRRPPSEGVISYFWRV